MIVQRAIKTVLVLAAIVFFNGSGIAATEIGEDQYILFYHNDALGSPVVVTDHNGIPYGMSTAIPMVALVIG